MGKVKALWSDRMDAVYDRFMAEEISYSDGLSQLISLGLDPADAEEHMYYALHEREEVNGQFGVGA